MHHILVINPKGGCGKTTIATNLAGYYASRGIAVALADFDEQGSSMDWLAARDEQHPPIHGIAAWRDPMRAPRDTEKLIMDVPAALHGKQLNPLVRRAETLIIPVLPSPIDIRAAARFIHELLLVGKVDRQQVKLAVVANRVREHTLIYLKLEQFLRQLKIPRIATLRDTQNYIRAAERGLSIFEMAPSLVATDLEQWKPLLRWVNGKRARADA